MNCYRDGQERIAAHRHDFWTCLISLGADRILTVDHRPVLMRDGDLVVFGTQIHGLPAMPEVSEPRISLVIFFYPDADNLERRQWETVEGDEEGEQASSTSTAPHKAQETQEPNQLRLGVDTGFQTSILWGERSAPAAVQPGALGAAAAANSGDALAKVMAQSHSQCGGGQAVTSGSSSREGPATILALGADLRGGERELFARLGAASVSSLWDLRSPEALKRAPAFAIPETLRGSCARRGIAYRPAPLGKRSAGGILGHLASEEGRDTLSRLAAEAAATSSLPEGGRKLTALLGAAEDWQRDDRRAICDALASRAYGHLAVAHLHAGGAVEPHIAPQATLESPSAEAAVEKDWAAADPGAAASEATERSEPTPSAVKATSAEPRVNRWARRGPGAEHRLPTKESGGAGNLRARVRHPRHP
ncbi:unnamed protein product [Polarella glacialis]|uniref:Uncharacterized protein n=1 Tax=Polarella glacialis TaxID=89957 RepID=A0A813L8C5_POLGL|nr:unnamed protein product [Polarella glacialis]